MRLTSHARTFGKTAVGTLLGLAAPRLAESDPTGEPASSMALRLRRWVLHARLERARWRGDAARIEATLHDFWRGQTGDDFYDRYAQRFERWFNGPHRAIIDRMADLADRRNWSNLVEIGCGDGRALSHLATVLPGIRSAVGIDINPRIIARDRIAHAGNRKLRFMDCDACAVLPDLIVPGTLLFSYGGVLEYFTAEHLDAIFDLVRAAPGSAIALVEPVDPAHDLFLDPTSHVFGGENSFSHNHAARAARAGLAVRFQQEIVDGGVRWMMLLAEAD